MIVEAVSDVIRGSARCDMAQALVFTEARTPPRCHGRCKAGGSFIVHLRVFQDCCSILKGFCEDSSRVLSHGSLRLLNIVKSNGLSHSPVTVLKGLLELQCQA